MANFKSVTFKVTLLIQIIFLAPGKNQISIKISDTPSVLVFVSLQIPPVLLISISSSIGCFMNSRL